MRHGSWPRPGGAGAGTFRQAGEETAGSWLWRPGIRTAVPIGIALIVFSQINSVNMILLYAPTVFMEAA
jgi:hypothetical protein